MPMKLQQEHKDWIYEQSRKEVIELFERDGAPPKSMGNICFQWSYAAARLMREFGIRAEVQAGTCVWPLVDADQIDPTNDKQVTEYGYVFDAIKTQAIFDSGVGIMPEIHCWVTTSQHTLVDMTVGEWPAHVEKSSDLKWIGKLPPKYLWIDDIRSPDHGYRLLMYHSDKVAIRLVKAIQLSMGMVL